MRFAGFAVSLLLHARQRARLVSLGTGGAQQQEKAEEAEEAVSLVCAGSR